MYNKVVLTTFTVSQARAALPQLLDRVGAGEELTITRHGKAVAVLVAPDALRSRRADHAIAEAGAIRDAMERARRAPLPAHPAISQERGDALLEEIRSGRSSR